MPEIGAVISVLEGFPVEMPHWIDIALGMVLMLFALGGWRRGLVRSVVDGIGFIVGLLLAVTYMSAGATWISGSVHLPEKLAAIASFLGIFLVAMLGFRVLGNLLRRVLHVTPVGWADSGAGTLFGLFKGAFVLSLLLLLIAMTPLSEKISGQMRASALAGPIGRVAPFVFDQVKRFFPRSEDFYSEVQECLGLGEGPSLRTIMESWGRVREQGEQLEERLEKSREEAEKVKRRMEERGK